MKLSLVPSLKQPVSKAELASLKRDRKELEALRAEVEAMAQELRHREQGIINRIESGAPSDGGATVIVRRRQNISWHTVVKRELGDEAIIRVKNEWPVSFYKELQLA